MASRHLLSTSLFNELFQHNMVSADGMIIANEEQLEDYYSFLVQQSKDKVTDLYAERKNLVKEAEKLLQQDCLTKEQEYLLQRLLDALDLEYDEDGEFLQLKEPTKPCKKYLGPTEPKKSSFEKKADAELHRVKILKRDLRTLDDWLDQLSQFRPTTSRSDKDWKEASRKFRQRTKNRLCDMENARSKLIKHQYEDYDKELQSVLQQKKRNKVPKPSKGAAADKASPSSSKGKKEEREKAKSSSEDKNKGETAESSNEDKNGEREKAQSSNEDKDGESEKQPNRPRKRRWF